jgi:hypothetical protein
MKMKTLGIVAIAAAVLVAIGGSSATALDGAWTTPVNLSVSGENANMSRIAADPIGNLTTVWYRFDGANLIVQSSFKPLGGDWTPPENVSAAGFTAMEVDLVVDSIGTATAVWQQFDGGQRTVQASRRTAGGTWTLSEAVSVSSAAVSSPHVAIDGGGNVTAVWSRWDGTNDVVEASTLPLGGTWSTPVILSSPGFTSDYPRIAEDAAGDIAVVWQASTVGLTFVQASTLVAGGSWSPPVDISPGEVGFSPAVTIDGGGNATIIWQHFVGRDSSIQASVWVFGGGWSSPVDVSEGGGNAENPELAADADGTVTAVWDRSDGSNNMIQVGTLPRSGVWSTPENLSVVGADATTPQIAVDGNGNRTVIWTRFDGSNEIVQTRTQLAGGPWSVPVDLSDAGNSAIQPRIFADAQGALTALWGWDDGSSYILQVSSHVAPVETVVPSLARTGVASELVAGEAAIALLLLLSGVFLQRVRARKQCRRGLFHLLS